MVCHSARTTRRSRCRLIDRAAHLPVSFTTCRLCCGAAAFLEHPGQGFEDLQGHLLGCTTVLNDVQVGLGIEGRRWPISSASRWAGSSLCMRALSGVGVEPLQQQLLWGIEPDHHPLLQLAPVLWPQHHTATGGYHQ